MIELLKGIDIINREISSSALIFIIIGIIIFGVSILFYFMTYDDGYNSGLIVALAIIVSIIMIIVGCVLPKNYIVHINDNISLTVLEEHYELIDYREESGTWVIEKK